MAEEGEGGSREHTANGSVNTNGTHSNVEANDISGAHAANDSLDTGSCKEDSRMDHLSVPNGSYSDAKRSDADLFPATVVPNAGAPTLATSSKTVLGSRPPLSSSSASSSSASGFNSVWVEKYRPRVLSDIVGNEAILSRLMAVVHTGSMPNLLLAGPPGIGKTTSVLCICHEMLGSNYKEDVLQLNASDDRGIDVVREKIKTFAKKSSSLPPGKHKMIILDEADSMTEGAQQALRRVMEEYSDSTRFALACNQSSKIIEPIQSRCAIVRFTKLTDQQITKRLLYICKAESLEYDSEGIRTLVLSAEGDLRNAVNNIQATATGFTYITKENVLRVCALPSPERLTRMLNECLNGRIREAKNITTDLIRDGYSPSDILGTLRSVLKRFECPENILIEFLKVTGATQAVMDDGLDSVCQLDKLLGLYCKLALCLGAPAIASQQSQ